MKTDDKTELFPVVDEEGVVVGCVSRGECHGGGRQLHPVVHLHLLNSKGELYLQHRPSWKEIQPDKWDTAVGGHVDYGETVAEALVREVREELGIEVLQPRFLLRYVFESERERELVYVYTAVYDGDVFPSDELAGGRFWALDEVRSTIGQGVFTPNFEQEFMKIADTLLRCHSL